MYIGQALTGQAALAMTYEREKQRGYQDALRQLHALDAIKDADARYDAEVILTHDMDEAADLEKVSAGYIRGWRLGLDEVTCERNGGVE